MTTFPKRLLAGFLSLALLVSFVPTAILPHVAFAEDNLTVNYDNSALDEALNRASSISDTGLIPNPKVKTITKDNGISIYAAGSAPSSYDLRSSDSKNLVTEVKNQNPWGDCWSFGSNGAAEVSLASTLGKTTNDLDLSERHTAWFLNTPLTSSTDLLPEAFKSQAGEGQVYVNGGNRRMNTGGNSTQAAQLFASGIGATSESVAPYGNNGKTMSSSDTWEVSESSRFSSVARLKNYNNLGSTAEWNDYSNHTGYSLSLAVLNRVKSEILAGRAVELSYKADQAQPGASADSTYMNRTTWGQFNPNYSLPDHSVLIVGYDDNFSKDSFNTAPEGDGAFIVKNSWGHSEANSGLSYGDVNYGSYGIDNSGYFYLSYYDRTINSLASFEFDGDSYSDSPYGVGDKIIDQYDFMPMMSAGNSYIQSDEYKSGSIFTATENQTLNSVTTYTHRDDITVQADVYKLNTNATNPADGEKVATSSQSFPYAGIHSVSLTALTGKDLNINKGDKYGVVISLKDIDGFYYVTYLMNYDRALGGSTYGNAVVNVGESYLSNYDNSSGAFVWQNWNMQNLGISSYSGQFVLDNPMIKVYSTKVASSSTKHNVTFKDGSNSLTISGAPTAFDEGSSITLPAAPSKSGYTFDGWYKDSAFANKAGDAGATYSPTETADITLYAKYSLKTTKITWDLQSGTSVTITALNGTADSILTYSQACSVLNNGKFTAPTRTGYTFKGFYDAATNGKKYINADLTSAIAWDKDVASATLYAQWEANTYNLKYIVDGEEDTSLSPKTWVFGSNGNRITLPTPTKAGYTFDGWYTDANYSGKISTDGVSFNTTHYEDKTLYGRFIGKETALTFNMVGGTAATSPTGVKATFGSAMPALSTGNIPTKTGYTFDGFFDAENGGTKYYNTVGTSANFWDKDVTTATLYAHWVSTAAPTHSVTFKDGNDILTIAGAPTEFTEGGSIELPAAPEKTGYTFAGWCTDEALTTVVGIAGAHYSPTATADLTLYAKYEAKTYSVTYKFNSSAADVSENRTYGVAYNLLSPTDAQKPSTTATFEGWYKTYDASTGAFSDKVDSIATTDETAYTLYAKWTYKFIEGQKVTISIKASDDVVIRVDFPLSRLISITINGVDIKSLVEGTDYTLVEGSTLLTIKNAYVKKMNVGVNDVVFTYENGTAAATVTVTNDEEPVVPDPEPDNPGPVPTPDPDQPSSDISEPDNGGVTDDAANNPVQPSQKAQVAKTGDNANGIVFGLLTLLVAGAVVLVVSVRRKDALK